jgi:CspA family cold shock protein
MATGTVKWFNEKKGYGFIIPDGMELDVFVHYSVIQTEGFKTLAEGEKVQFEMTQDVKGARATVVQRLGGGTPA